MAYNCAGLNYFAIGGVVKKHDSIGSVPQDFTRRYRCAQSAPSTSLEILQGEMLEYKKKQISNGVKY